MIFLAPALVKHRPVNQPSNEKTTESVHKTLTAATSEQQPAEKGQGGPEVCENDGLYQKQVLKVSPRLKEEH